MTDVPTPANARGPGPRRGRRLLARLALSLGSLLAVGALLEVVARLVVDVPVLWQVDDRYHHHSLPVASGNAARGWSQPDPLGDATLPLQKEPGEVRVFVFGESSVQGAPWGLRYSPPALLADRLAETDPGRHYTVVNLGRTSTMTIDAYYYLVAVAPYRPDVVVFYQGSNDQFDSDVEMCAPALHPGVHRAWRWLVERSRLLWTARVRGPGWLHALAPDGEDRGPFVLGPPRCPPAEGFRAWTRILVDTATSLGARVVVATPLASDLWDLDEGHGPAGLRPVEPTSPLLTRPRHETLAAAVAAITEPYGALLGCVLDEACASRLVDDPARVAPAGGAAEPSRELAETFRELSKPKREQMALRGALWRESAQRVGGAVLEFNAFLRAREPGGLLVHPLIQDGVHLSLDASWLLAWHLARIVAALGRGEVVPPEPTDVPAPQGARYADRMADDEARGAGPSYCRVLNDEWKRWLRERHLMIGASIARTAAGSCRDEQARTLLDWLRVKLGRGASLPPDRRRALDALDVEPLLARPEWHP